MEGIGNLSAYTLDFIFSLDNYFIGLKSNIGTTFFALSQTPKKKTGGRRDAIL